MVSLLQREAEMWSIATGNSENNNDDDDDNKVINILSTPAQCVV